MLHSSVDFFAFLIYEADIVPLFSIAITVSKLAFALEELLLSGVPELLPEHLLIRKIKKIIAMQINKNFDLLCSVFIFFPFKNYLLASCSMIDIYELNICFRMLSNP